MRVHNRRDLRCSIIRGRARFSRVAYACIITQATAFDDERAIYHIETFFGDDATKVRAQARRYGGMICRGERGVCGFREQTLSTIFPRPADLPKPENKVDVRYAE